MDPTEEPNYSADPYLGSGEEEDVENSILTEVSEETHKLLTTACTRSVPLEVRKRTRGRFKLPKVEATRTPKMDHVMRSLAPQAARSADKELARIQTFVLDSLAPVTAILENGLQMSRKEVTEATSAAAILIGNANAQISHLRREKLVTSINKNLTPLVKDDADFTEVAPNLFGADFSKRAKEHLDQVKSLRYSTRAQQDSGRKPLFCRGFPSGRGAARGRGGGPSRYRGSAGEKHSSARQ